MELQHQEIRQRTGLLFEMLAASHGLSHWIYDSQGNCLETNSQSMALDAILSQGTGKRDMIDHGRVSNVPLLLSMPLGLLWVVDFEHREGKLHRAYVLGPAFHTEMSMKGLSDAIDRYQIPQSWRRGFTELMRKLPVLSVNSLRRSAVMLHYSITGEKISDIDIVYQQTDGHLRRADSATEQRDRHRTYMAEQRLLNNVRDGNLNFRAALEEAGALSSGVSVKTDTALAQVRTTQVVFISLCVRAAIEGGLTPDMAYSIGDAYIQQVNDTEDLSRLGNIGHTMYQQFIQLVHDSKQRTGLSKPIQSCCSYIQLHLEEELTAQMLSERIGYTPGYLARRFSREVGCSPVEYLQQERIRRACQLLTTTTDPISEISQRLHFCNRGYFSTVFKARTGLTPAEYRSRHQAR